MGRGGKGEDSSGLEVLNDPQFAPFQSTSFDVASFTSRVLAGSQTTAQAQAEQLKDGVRTLDTELSAQVTGRNRELLGNVRRLLDVEHSVQDVVLGVESLQSAVRRIRAEIAGPYEHIRARTQQLNNLHATVDMLRHLIHRLKLTQKLRAQLSGPPGSIDLAKAAKLITDIHAVDAEVNLSGIEVIEADHEFLKQASITVHEQAEAALIEGMESMSQAKVGSALQVFFNLEELGVAVNRLMSRYLHDLERAAKSALDARHLTGSTAPGSPGAAGRGLGASPGAAGAAGTWQDKLWSGVKEVCDQLQACTTAVWHLQRVVAKKKDPLTHVCFLDVLLPQPVSAEEEPQLLTQKFWDDAVRVLADAMSAAFKPVKGGVVRDALVAGYPRLANALEASFERLMAETTMKGVLPAVAPTQLHQLLGAAAPFQGAYLAACLARMSEAVVAAFPGGTRALPSPADVQKCIGIMHEELKMAGSSPQLASMIASTVGKALQLLAEKAEYMAATGPELRAIPSTAGAAANGAQLRNIALCSALQEVHRSLSGLLARLPQTAAPALAASLEAVQGAAIEMVAPIFKSVMESLEERILKMHIVDFGGSEAGQGMVNTSPYIVEVSTIIANFRGECLSKFVPAPSPNVPSCVGALVERMACRLLIFFVRHASLVRPLSQAGKLQVAKDMAELQLSVGTHLFPLEQLGMPYRVLKAFRALLFQDTPGIPSSPLIKELPPSITLHHLFSRLPPAIQAPHELSGLSPAQYSAWLDTHSMEDMLSRVCGALECVGIALKAQPEVAEVLAVAAPLCGLAL